ncbi:protein ENHANCED DOWNY MILDEW 2-like [Bidens hawaiensis]|uniref:protein ENHANCED DOWNY MILDEW 2-like n=1 Tax=Bidens hawaiensis TaxID=980011 RepID=UPI004049A028
MTAITMVVVATKTMAVWGGGSSGAGGTRSNCGSLRLTSRELEGVYVYQCENCRYSLHQCAVCSELGRSDISLYTEVFRCSYATCGHFYHPKCVARLLQNNDITAQRTLKHQIAAGEAFICPAHRCAVCNQIENERVVDFQFAICRRCPKAYHRRCLPRGIKFAHEIGEDDNDDDDDARSCITGTSVASTSIVRAWDGLLPKSRALIYCLEHEIDPDLATPARTIKFRNILIRNTVQLSKKKPAVKVTGGDSVDSPKKKSVLKSQQSVKKCSAIKPEGSSKKRAAVSSGSEPLKKKKLADGSKRSVPTEVKKPSLNDGQPSLWSRLFDFFNGTESKNVEKDETSVDDNNNQTVEAKPQQTEVLPLDDESKQRIMALVREASSSVKLEEVKKYHQGKVPSTHAHSSRVDKLIKLSKVEGSVEAINVALKKLEEGCSVQDAMAVCDPSDIDQLMKWKEKLRVYLAPFLHGKRYTSFGRHFTKVEKLEKIVDKLHWYIEDGDTVVDFCCGANDFSCLMKKKLDETGKKKCSYKNFDITRPKNDFNFEKRDWMKVSPRELPSGSQLVMGLNPPFGTKAALANKFIDHALKFKPKLIVLIVPPETER